jgi:hypothetical protein
MNDKLALLGAAIAVVLTMLALNYHTRVQPAKLFSYILLWLGVAVMLAAFGMVIGEALGS